MLAHSYVQSHEINAYEEGTNTEHEKLKISSYYILQHLEDVIVALDEQQLLGHLEFFFSFFLCK